MKNISMKERSKFYSKVFPKYPPLRADERWLDGIWFMGNNYRSKTGYYGSYPPQYLKRIMSLFPDAENILHLFSGSIKEKGSCTFDINGNLDADVVGDANQLSHYFDRRKKMDLILADPPYTSEDAEHYGAPMINRNKVIKECAKITKKGGFLLWLDQVLPMFRKDEWLLCIAIGMVRSTNHRFRIVSGFKRV